MKKRIVCFLLVVCMATALLPVGVLAAGEGTLDKPWTIGNVKVYLDGSTLHVYGQGAIIDYEPGAQPWFDKSGRVDTVVIETGITGIGKNAFSCCGGMDTLRLKRNVTDKGALLIGQNALPLGIDVQVEVTGTGYMADNSSNQPWANLKTKLTSVIIEEGVRSVGKQAFAGCDLLKSVEIPSTVEIIGQEAFASTAVTDVLLKHDFASDLQIGTGAFPVANSGFKINMEITGSAAIPDYADMNLQPWAGIRTYIRNLTIGGDVAGIGDNAFNGCTGLSGVTIRFNEHSLKAEKTFGNNWLRENSTIPVSVEGYSENAAFKTWGGSSFVNATSEATLLHYNRNKLTVTAEWSPVAYGIVVDPKDHKVFAEMEVGYAQIDPYTVTVTNNGNKATGQLLVELTGGQTDAFDLSTKYIDSLAIGESAQVSVAPKTGLTVGDYNSNVAISNSEGTVASFKVSFIASTNRSRMERFVKRLYEKCLGREAEPDGLKNWIDQLSSGKMTASQVAASFFASEEFRLKGHSNADYVKTLYRTMMDREFDEGGLKNWVDQLNAGKTRAWVFKQFCDSAEFQKLCADYTLPWGTIDDTQYNIEAMKPAVNTAAAQGFVERLYSTTLGRQADATGLKHWVEQLTKQKMTGAQVAASFFASPEYLTKNRGNQDFLEDLYVAMMGRGSDASGKSHWSSQMVLGKSRCWVFKQFCDSAEFKSICDSYGIVNGTVTENQYNMTPVAAPGSEAAKAPVVEKAVAEAFVNTLYQSVLGRSADATGLKDWTEKVMAGTKGLEVTSTLLASAEFQNKKLSNEEYVKVLYRALFGREADTAGLETWTGSLELGKARTQLLKELSGVAECTDYYAGMGVAPGSIK